MLIKKWLQASLLLAVFSVKYKRQEKVRYSITDIVAHLPSLAPPQVYTATDHDPDPVPHPDPVPNPNQVTHPDSP